MCEYREISSKYFYRTVRLIYNESSPCCVETSLVNSENYRLWVKEGQNLVKMPAEIRPTIMWALSPMGLVYVLEVDRQGCLLHGMLMYMSDRLGDQSL
jgi:hypothetical protein